MKLSLMSRLPSIALSGAVAFALNLMVFAPVQAHSDHSAYSTAEEEEQLMAEDEMENLSYAENEALPQELKDAEKRESRQGEMIDKN
jgi:uncharacterized membrane protein YgcG